MAALLTGLATAAPLPAARAQRSGASDPATPAPVTPLPPPAAGAAQRLSGAALLQGDDPLVIGPGLGPAAPASTAAKGDTPLRLPAASDVPAARELVLERGRRQLRVLENGRELFRFPVAVGMPGWETPVGRFTVLEKRTYPVWEHPQSGERVAGGYANPLGSRWIGFHRDCKGRRGWDGDQMLDFSGCVVAGFHGTPHRWTVGRAVSHGCVRLYDEDVKRLYELVSVGTPVTVLP